MNTSDLYTPVVTTPPTDFQGPLDVPNTAGVGEDGFTQSSAGSGEDGHASSYSDTSQLFDSGTNKAVFQSPNGIPGAAASFGVVEYGGTGAATNYGIITEGNIVELILNILLLIFLIYFIISKLKFKYKETTFNTENYKSSLKIVILKTISFTYLNPHVYSDTVFFLGNFSKNFHIMHKYLFGLGASLSSFIFFFSLGYLSKLLSKQLNNQKTWQAINAFIILFMGSLALYISIEIVIDLTSMY